jgi:hypothetical protein
MTTEREHDSVEASPSEKQLDARRYGSGDRALFYVVDWLPPDFGAVGQYAMVFAREFARSGRRVFVVGLTSGRAVTTQEVCGAGVLEIRRIAAARYDKSRVLNRLLWTLTTNLRLLREVIRHPAARGASLLFTGSPPFMLYFAFLAKLVRRVRLIYRITDFFPEAIIADRGRPSAALRLLQRLTWFLRRRVDTFEALGEDQRRLLIAGGIAPERIVLKRDRSPVEITGHEKPLPHPPELRGRGVLLYSGNYGVAHEVDTVVQGLIRHHREGYDRFALWLNASGTKAEPVAQQLRSAGVPFARSAPVPLDDLPALLAAADTHLVTLRAGFSGIVLPSKIYGCIQSAKPILFVGPIASDVHLLCAQTSNIRYERVEPGDVVGFSAALDRLSKALLQR